MEPSSAESSFSRQPLSSFDYSPLCESLNTFTDTSPTPNQYELSDTKSTNGPTGGSNSFAEILGSKLSFLPVQGESKCTHQLKMDYRRRSYRYSPYSRSRSLCSINVKSRSLFRRHASQNGTQKTVSTDKRLYSFKTPLTHGIRPSVEAMRVIATPVPANLLNAQPSRNNSVNRDSPVNKKAMVRTASLRKAESLRKLPETYYEELIPTAPSTPIKFSTPDRTIPSPIPIISPPPPTRPPVSLSAETIAKIRLGKYKEREGRTADYDYTRSLQIVGKPWSGSSGEWEILLGLGQRTRRRRIDWLLQFLPKNNSQSASSSFSSTSSTLSSSSFSAFDQSMEGLIDQLKTSPETRFHAAWMFLRYHYLMGVVRIRTESPTLDQLPIYPSGGIWDVTLASLAISVKFHRDFLHPLLPVEAVDYMQISPHDMGYEGLEYAQRTMLNAFDYQLGVTPQPFLDQVWISLPSLRRLLDFEGGWNQVKKATWWLLFNALYEPDVLKFSVSILTATTLSRAVVSVLTLRYHCKSDWNYTLSYPRVAEGGKWNFNAPKQFQDRARGDADDVITDIEATLGVCDIQLNECRYWFQARCGDESTF